MKYRHGDIAIKAAEHSFTNPISHDGSFAIALGEHSGHRHLLTVERPDDLIIEKTPNGYVFTLKREARLTHEEHKPLIIAPGTYRSTPQREVDHFAESIVNVQD